METTAGYDPAVWSQMADQLGLQGLIIPERFGGAGYGFLELVIVLEEMGRALLCAPYFSTVAMGASLLMASGDEGARKDYLPGIADGSLIATVALAEASGRWDEAGVALEATGSGDSWALTGEKLFVLDGVIADVVLVAARTRGGVSVLAVEKGAAGLEAVSMSTLDQTRKQARLTFDATPARLVGQEGHGWPAISAMLDLAIVALAAEQAGGAQRVLEMAVEYARARVQFGRRIGSFQAVKHKCADMLLEVESARSAAYYAGQAAATGDDELPALASLAKSCCSEAYSRAAAENIQVHGGIGFTWEHPAHLYFRRAKSSELLFGDPAYHRELLAQRILLACFQQQRSQAGRRPARYLACVPSSSRWPGGERRARCGHPAGGEGRALGPAAGGAGSRRQQVADCPDEPGHLEGELPGVALRRGEDREAGAVAYRLDEQHAVFHLHHRLGRHSAVEHPGRPLHQAGQPGDDGRELLDGLPGDVRQGQRHPVGRHHDRMRYVLYPRGELGDKPVQVLAIGLAQRLAPSPALGACASASRLPSWNPLRRARACSGDRRGSGVSRGGVTGSLS